MANSSGGGSDSAVGAGVAVGSGIGDGVGAGVAVAGTGVGVGSGVGVGVVVGVEVGVGGAGVGVASPPHAMATTSRIGIRTRVRAYFILDRLSGDRIGSPGPVICFDMMGNTCPVCQQGMPSKSFLLAETGRSERRRLAVSTEQSPSR